MAQPKPRIKFTVKDYMSTPEGTRYQLLDGEMILAPSPTNYHQTLVAQFFLALYSFVEENSLGKVWFSPFDVILSDTDVAQPDILFVSNARSSIVTEANIQGAPDLVVEVISPGTAQYDRGYKQVLYGRHNVLEYWQVDPEAQSVEVLSQGDAGLAQVASYSRQQALVSPLLDGLTIDLDDIFGAAG